LDKRHEETHVLSFIALDGVMETNDYARQNPTATNAAEHNHSRHRSPRHAHR